MFDCANHTTIPGATQSPAGHWRHALASCWLFTITITSAACVSLQAQEDRDFLPQVNPFPPYRSPEGVRYNLKWGKLTGRVYGSVNTEFNDNINLSQNNPEADISIGPTIGVGFLWPISKVNVLQFDVGVGYRWYLNHPAVSSINVIPTSRLDHNIFLQSVRINVHDYFSATSDPVTLGALSGGKVNVTDFHRFHNTAGLLANWRGTSKLGFSAGYDYSIDRSLSSQFTSLDRDDHTFTAGFDYLLSPRWTVGANGAYTITKYLENVQNDGTSFTFGPVVNYKYSQFLIFDASAGWTVSTYDQTGTIVDRSAFRGFTWQFGVRHTINRRTSQDLRFGRHLGVGFNNNFTDLLAVQYGLRRQITSAVWLHSTLAWEALDESGPAGETADRYLFSLGTSFRLSQHWSSAVAYTLSWKDSSLLGGDYVQNRLTLDITRHF